MSTLLLFIIGRNCAIVKLVDWVRIELTSGALQVPLATLSTCQPKKNRIHFITVNDCILFVFAVCILNLSSARFPLALTDSHLDASSSASYTILEIWWRYWSTSSGVFDFHRLYPENFAYQVRFDTHIYPLQVVFG